MADRIQPEWVTGIAGIRSEIVDIALPTDGLRSASRHRSLDSDELLALEPAFYVERLTGVEVGRDRKIACPFHDDRTPSLHVYCETERGWYCFGCGRGGSVYDFAAHLWGYKTSGRDFVALRRRLMEMCGARPTEVSP